MIQSSNNENKTANLLIRSVSVEDTPVICNIYNHYVRNTIITFETDDVSIEEMARRIENITFSLPWLVGSLDGEIIGYAYATKWRVRSAYRFSAESTVYLDNKFQGLGLGTALYKALIADLSKRSIHAIMGGIALPNPASIRLHEKLGFEKVAHFKQVGKKFGQWIDVGYWQLILNTDRVY